MDRTTFGSLLLVGLVVVGMAVPAMALSTSAGEPSTGDAEGVSATVAAQAGQNNSSVNVTVGPQLSTVIGVSSDEVQTDFESTAFELSFEGANEEAQAEAIAERADELHDRAESIREDYDEATEAYREGDLTKSEYAQRLAALNARATNLLNSYEQLRQRAANVSALELRAAGVNQSALDQSVENLSSVTGTGAEALLKQFTGESEGEIELETENGLSIAVESEDGERSREFERPRDDNDALTVSQSAALDTARGALSAPEAGNWVLTSSQVAEDDGAYEFAFVLRNAPNTAGEAEVSVDGSTGDIFALEEEIEPRDDEEDEDADEEADSDRELALVVSEGTPGPNETVVVRILTNGEPAENVTVYLNDRTVGTTDADGRITVTLPRTGEVELSARTDDAEGELEFEFENSEEEDEVFRRLAVDSTLDGDTVTTTVSYDGDGVENASIYVNGRAIGTTGADGTVTFGIGGDATEELELEVVKGEFEAELTYAVQNGTLSLIEEAHEGENEAENEGEEDSEDVEDDEQETESESESESEADDEEAETPEATETPEGEDEKETESEE